MPAVAHCGRPQDSGAPCFVPLSAAGSSPSSSPFLSRHNSVEAAVSAEVELADKEAAAAASAKVEWAADKAASAAAWEAWAAKVAAAASSSTPKESFAT